MNHGSRMNASRQVQKIRIGFLTFYFGSEIGITGCARSIAANDTKGFIKFIRNCNR